jgi:hypothetical protein
MASCTQYNCVLLRLSMTCRRFYVYLLYQVHLAPSVSHWQMVSHTAVSSTPSTVCKSLTNGITHNCIKYTWHHLIQLCVILFVNDLQTVLCVLDTAVCDTICQWLTDGAMCTWYSCVWYWSHWQTVSHTIVSSTPSTVCNSLTNSITHSCIKYT